MSIKVLFLLGGLCWDSYYQPMITLYESIIDHNFDYEIKNITENPIPEEVRELYNLSNKYRTDEDIVHLFLCGQLYSERLNNRQLGGTAFGRYQIHKRLTSMQRFYKTRTPNNKLNVFNYNMHVFGHEFGHLFHLDHEKGDTFLGKVTSIEYSEEQLKKIREVIEIEL